MVRCRRLGSSLNEHWTYCGGGRMRAKVGYPSKEGAKMSIVENNIGSKYDAYKCSVCGKWHIGHWHKRK